MERQARLRDNILAYAEENQKMPSFAKPLERHEEVKEEEFYTEGSADLRIARIEIAKYSVPLAAYRVER